MTVWVLIAGAGAFLASFLLTLVSKNAARLLGLIDVPNERSSHAIPTPRGGGLAIVLASIAAMAVLGAAGVVPARVCIALCGGGAMVAAVGFIDDCRSLSARIRLLVHFVAAAWAVAWIGPADQLLIGYGAHNLGWAGAALSVVGIVWFLNMFNFMDGIDGIAASQAVFMCAGIALLAQFWTGAPGIGACATVIGTATLGFLLWNWPPAKIFMGDVGSGYLGFVLAVLGLAGSVHRPSAPWSWLIVAGVFAIDSTLTVIRRFLRGEKVTAPHRTHAFQLLAQKMGHAKVTASVILLNLAWLAPFALVSVRHPRDAFWIAVIALCPLLLCAFAVGAGRAEAPAEAVDSPQRPSAAVIRLSRSHATEHRAAYDSRIPAASLAHGDNVLPLAGKRLRPFPSHTDGSAGPGSAHHVGRSKDQAGGEHSFEQSALRNS